MLGHMMPWCAFLGPPKWSWYWYCSPRAESDRRLGWVLALFMMWGGSADGDDAGPTSVTSAAECLFLVDDVAHPVLDLSLAGKPYFSSGLSPPLTKSLLSMNDGVETTEEGTMTTSSVLEMRLRSLWSRSESETFW